MPDATETIGSAAADPAKPWIYDAFLSYTHRDRPVASGIQKGLHRIGRRPGQLRALRVFRDDTNLEVSPDLWGKIVEALDRSRFLIVVLSPMAAESYWVNREVSYWLEHGGRDRLLIVLAAGQLHRDDEQARFDPQTSDATLPVLTQPGVLEAEPFYIDVSQDAPWDPRAASLREKVTALAAPVHGIPKDQLASDDLREQRRFRRLRAAATAGLVVLTVIAVVAGTVAVVQRQRAIEQRNAAIALRLDAEAQSILTGARPGSDARAFQELLAARQIGPHPGGPDDGPILDALVEGFSTVKVFDTQHPVNYMAVNATGDRLITLSGTGGLRVWNPNTGKKIGDADVTGNGVAFSPDGTRFAVATAGGDVGMWETRTGQLLRTFTGPAQASTRVRFSPDGRRIAAGALDGTAWVWNVDTGARELTLTEPGTVRAVAFSPPAMPGEPIIATGGVVDGTVRVWDAATGKLLRALKRDQGYVADLAFSPDGSTLASADASAVDLWNPSTGEDKGQLGYSGAVSGVAWNPDPANTELAASGTGGFVMLWNFYAGLPIDSTSASSKVLHGKLGLVNDVAYTADGSRLAAGGADGVVYTWAPSTTKEMRMFEPVTGVAWSLDGQRIAAVGAAVGSEAAVGSDGVVQLWDPRTLSSVGDELRGQKGIVNSVAFDPREKLVAAGGDGGTVSLWDRDSGRLIRTLPGKTRVWSVAFESDGRLIASGGDDRSVKLWEPDSGELKRTLIGPTDRVSSVAFNAVEGLVVAGSNDGKLYIWDTDTGRLRHLISTPARVTTVAFSPDGRRIVSGGHENVIRVWDTDTGTAAMDPLTGHSNAVDSVAFSPDGRYIASGSDDWTVRLWDAGTGQPIGTPMTGHGESVYSVAFSPDGRQLVSGSLDRTLEMWPGSVSADDLCAKLTANPSHKQWNDWITPDIDYIPVCPNLQPAPDSG
jgi:WD40 repeat protein